MRGRVLPVLAALAVSACLLTAAPLRAEKAKSDLPRVVITTDLVYGHKDGMALTMDLFRPRQANGAAILFINSGGFHSPVGDSRQCRAADGSEWGTGSSGWSFIRRADRKGQPIEQYNFQALLDSGFTLFDVRHGSAPRYNVEEIIGDCRTAVRFVRARARELSIDPDRIGVWGASSGGYLAALLATASDAGDSASADPVERTSSRVQAVGLYYPAGYDFVSDVRRAPNILEALPAMQIGEERMAAISIKRFISADDPPALILYGNEDAFFITEASEAMASDFRKCGVPCRLVVYPGTGHMFRGKDGQISAEYSEKAMTELVGWFRKHLDK